VTHTHNRIIYMVTIFFPSHEITITSKIELASTDTHNRIIYMLRFFLLALFQAFHNLFALLFRVCII
jgi:hypothetical protein